MKFKETTYSNKTEILKFPDHYVGMAVMVKEGQNLKAGDVVGGETKSVLANLDEPVVKKNTASTHAYYTTEFTGDDKNLKFTAKKAGADGNDLSVTFIDPSGNDQGLEVSVVGKGEIQVSLATGGAGSITSTAAEIKAAIEAHYLANRLVEVEFAPDFANDENPTGAGVVEAFSEESLTGGTDGLAQDAEGILFHDVDATEEDRPATMLIHGFVNIAKLPEAPAVEAVAALKQIQFLK